VREGVLTLNQLIEKMSCNPSNILGLNRGSLKAGAPADITLIDPEREWAVEADKLASKSKNSPWLGQKMKGAATATFVSGNLTFER